MKKLLLALLLGGLLVLALVTVASADNGPHGGFTATTDSCAGCHRAHTAQFGSNALLITDPEDLCMSCHGGGAGAFTNVANGVYGSGSEGAHWRSVVRRRLHQCPDGDCLERRDYRKPGLQCHLAPHDIVSRRGRCWHDLGLGRQQQRQWSDGARMHLLP